MSNVWGTRYRLLLEELEKMADQLSGDQQQEPAAVTEHTVRLLTFASILLRQHHINKRGQCEFCGWTRWKWRFWHRRPQCTVYRALVFTASEGMDVVWWRLSESMGKQRSLVQVRQWLRQRDQDARPAAADSEAALDETVVTPRTSE